MALDSKELMLEKFVSVNKERYPEFSDRLDKVSAVSITFETIATDPNNPEIGRVSNLGSEAMFIQAEEQTWQCATLNGDRVLNFTDETVYSTLDEIVGSKSRGIFKYQDGEEIKVAHLIPTLETDFNNILDMSLLDINGSANYRLKKSEITMLSSPAPGHYETLVNGATIHGIYTIVCQNPDHLIAGDWIKGYYGQVMPADFMSPELVAELVGIPTAKIIYREQNIWLKFAYKGKTILIAQKPVAYNISYTDLVGLHLTEGNRVLTIKNENYGVRVPIGNPGATDYNEWEDLLYNVSATAPGSLLWESFTNDQLGVGLTASNTQRTMGEWNWMYRTDLSMTTTYARGGNGNGMTAATNSAPGNTGTTRGFRPVLVMDGVSGITAVSFKQLNPKQLIPLRTPVAGTTDAFPIKNIKWKPWTPVPVYFTPTFAGDVYRITSVQTKQDKAVPAPDFVDAKLNGSVSRIMDVTFKTDYRAPGAFTSELSGSIKGIFSLTKIGLITQPPAPAPMGNNIGDVAMKIRLLDVDYDLAPLQPLKS